MPRQDHTPEFVELGVTPLSVGRSPACGLRLVHSTVSRQHATLERFGERITVVDHDSRYGTFVNGTRVRKSQMQQGDRVQFGTVLSYRAEMNGLRLDRTEGGMRLELAGVHLCKSGKTLVQGIELEIAPGAFVGILGPSGSGKSTLLNCLAGYLLPSQGRATFDDGHAINDQLATYKAGLAYVTQEDVVFTTLTARENLVFAAQLRFGSIKQSAKIGHVVDQVMEQVGLVDHQHKRAAMLSGGQRKRLSVAIELLQRPRLLLLDEPTAGLDPASEARLMEQVKLISRRGTTVVCTTHLMDGVRLFDCLIVLGRREGVGRIAYVGNPDGLLAHFQCRSFADLYELLEAGRFQPLGETGEASEATPTMKPKTGLPTDRRAGEAFSEASVEVSSYAQPATMRTLVTNELVSPTSMQLLLVTRRALHVILRDHALVAAMLAQPVILGLLVCLTQFRPGYGTPLIFFTVAVAIWLGLNNSIRELVRERKHYVRERLIGLEPDAYFASKSLLFGAVGCVQLVLLWTVVRFGGTYVSEDLAIYLASLSSFWILCVLLLAYIGGLGLGIFVSAIVRTEEAAIAALPLLILPQLLLSTVAIGDASQDYSEAKVFRPLIACINRTTKDDALASKPGWAQTAVQCLSMFCLSRPATIAAEFPDNVDGRPRWICFGDFCHLLVLVLGAWTIAYVAFRRAEQRWPWLVGLG